MPESSPRTGAAEGVAQIAGISRSLDLAIIIPSLNKYGGAERFAIECVARWQDRHSITLYSTSFNDALLREHGIGNGVTRVQMSGDLDGEHATLLNALLLPKLWTQEIGRHDVYHTHLWPTHLIDLHPMVWYPHEPFRAAFDLRYEQGGHGLHVYPKYAYDHLADRYREASLSAIRGADRSGRPDRIVANSRYTAGYLQQVYGRPVTDVVYPGAEPPRRIDLPRDPNLFVTISQLWDHKRVRVLIEAIALTDGAQLIVIGSGPDEAWLRELATGLGVRDRVFFFSGLSNDELSLILARANGFLFAAVREPFGIAVLEAMEAGLPVIAVNEGGFTELCTPENSFLLPPFPAAFAAKIHTLQSDTGLANRMGAAGRATAAQYTWSRTADELETLLVDTASRAPVTAAMAGDEDRPLLGAQYYLWYAEGYGAEHWNDNPATGHVDDRPLLGYYGSNKASTIEVHLDMVERMGLDFLVLNLHVDDSGSNSQEMKGIEALLGILETRQAAPLVAIQIAPYTADADVIAGVLADIRRKFLGKPYYLQAGGEPVVFWFWSTSLDRHCALLERLRAATGGIVNIALSSRLPAGGQELDLTGGLFKGFAPFSPLELAERANQADIWNAGYRQAGEAGMTWRVATISPGYDDSGLRDSGRASNRYRVVPRENGDTYARGMSWLEGLQPAPHFAVISTFNEYHENSHIEPSQRHGELYLNMTGALAGRLRKSMGGSHS